MDPDTAPGEMELTAHRRSIEQLLDLALKLRGELAQEADPPGVHETMQAIRALGERVRRQQVMLGSRESDAAAARRRHVDNILGECTTIFARRPMPSQ